MGAVVPADRGLLCKPEEADDAGSRATHSALSSRRLPTSSAYRASMSSSCCDSSCDRCAAVSATAHVSARLAVVPALLAYGYAAEAAASSLHPAGAA